MAEVMTLADVEMLESIYLDELEIARRSGSGSEHSEAFYRNRLLELRKLKPTIASLTSERNAFAQAIVDQAHTEEEQDALLKAVDVIMEQTHISLDARNRMLEMQAQLMRAKTLLDRAEKRLELDVAWWSDGPWQRVEAEHRQLLKDIRTFTGESPTQETS